MEAMCAHAGSAAVHVQACKALFNLTYNNTDNVAKARAAGAADLARNAKERHAGESSVVTQANILLRRIG